MRNRQITKDRCPGFIRVSGLVLGVAGLLVLAGCASRPINEPITQVDPTSGYRPSLLVPKRENNAPST